jgi:hypothetical protein
MLLFQWPDESSSNRIWVLRTAVSVNMDDGESPNK